MVLEAVSGRQQHDSISGRALRETQVYGPRACVLLGLFCASERTALAFYGGNVLKVELSAHLGGEICCEMRDLGMNVL